MLPRQTKRRIGPRSLLVWPLLLLLALCGIGSGWADVPQVAALRIDQPPVIDGNLDDACWKDAASFALDRILYTGARESWPGKEN